MGTELQKCSTSTYCCNIMYTVTFRNEIIWSDMCILFILVYRNFREKTGGEWDKNLETRSPQSELKKRWQCAIQRACSLYSHLFDYL